MNQQIDPLEALINDTFSGDIPYSVAEGAHSGTSFVPERRASSEIEGHAEQLRADFQSLLNRATTPEKRQVLADEWPRYRAGYRKYKIAYLGSRSRIVSAMIAGPSNFPSHRMNKRSETSHRRLEELINYREKAMSAIIKKMYPERAAVMSSDADAADKLRYKIAILQANQERMKAANAAIRRNAKKGEEAQVAALQAEGFTEEQAHKLIKPSHCTAYGFASYSLSNNNAEITRLKKRLEQVEYLQSREDIEEERENAVLTIAFKENRVRLEFAGKPDEETRSRLKKRGFRWSRTLGVWQAYVNTYSVDEARAVAGPRVEAAEEVAEPEAEPQPEEEQTEEAAAIEEAPGVLFDEPAAPTEYKEDEALDTAKQNEMARLTRRHIETTLATPKAARGDFAQTSFCEEPRKQGAQFLLF